MKLLEAKQIAEKYVEILKSYCERIEIAGSIRREKPEVRDIEIVCIPKIEKGNDFWGDGYGTCYNTLEEFLAIPKFCWVFLKNGPKYKQILLPEGIKLDLFVANRDNWGNIFLIRTGNMEFSKWIMGTRARQVGLLQKDGYLWREEERLSCPEEENVFRLLKLDWVEPRERNGAGIKRSLT